MSDEMNPVETAEKEGRLLAWAKGMSPDAQLIIRLLPFGGHVRLRPSVAEELSKNAAPVNPLSWMTQASNPSGDDEDIEGFTVEASHLQSFLRAQGETRTGSRDRVGAALTELTLRDLVKVFQDESESPRYALTETGLKVQAVINAEHGA